MKRRGRGGHQGRTYEEKQEYMRNVIAEARPTSQVNRPDRHSA